jgi:hypothetical protein
MSIVLTDFIDCENASESIESIIKRLIKVDVDGELYVSVVGLGVVTDTFCTTSSLSIGNNWFTHGLDYEPCHVTVWRENAGVREVVDCTIQVNATQININVAAPYADVTIKAIAYEC